MCGSQVKKIPPERAGNARSIVVVVVNKITFMRFGIIIAPLSFGCKQSSLIDVNKDKKAKFAHAICAI